MSQSLYKQPLANTVLGVTECSFRRTALNSLRFGHEEAALRCPLLD